MRPGKRFGLPAIEKSDIWRRWKAGQTLHEIVRAFDKPHTSIRCLLLPRGGIPPAARHRSRLALTLAELLTTGPPTRNSVLSPSLGQNPVGGTLSATCSYLVATTVVDSRFSRS